MRNKIKLSVFSILLLFVIIAGQLQFTGCASSSKQLTPEQQQAIKDSLMAIQKFELRKNMSIAMIAFQNKEYEKAAHYYNRVVVADTIGEYTTTKYQNLAHCYVQLGKPDSAAIIYRKGIELYPEHSYFYNGLGYIYRMSGDNTNAIDMLEKLLKLEPENTKAMDDLSDLYITEEENESAKSILKKLIELEPNNSKAQEKLAMLLGADGDVGAIIAQRETMVERNPENMTYRRDLADVYYRETMFEKAVEQLKVITAQNPEDKYANELLADCYKTLRKFDEAVTIYNRLIEMDNQDKKNIYNLAVCYIDMGRYTQALRQAAKALNIDPNYGNAYFAKGLTYETAASNCVKKNDGKTDYSDKLVYQMAYDEFVKAAKDPAVKSLANDHLRYLKDMIPTTGDKFMHKKQTRPEGDCYKWIN